MYRKRYHDSHYIRNSDRRDSGLDVYYYNNSSYFRYYNSSHLNHHDHTFAICIDSLLNKDNSDKYNHDQPFRLNSHINHSTDIDRFASRACNVNVSKSSQLTIHDHDHFRTESRVNMSNRLLSMLSIRPMLPDRLWLYYKLLSTDGVKHDDHC